MKMLLLLIFVSSGTRPLKINRHAELRRRIRVFLDGSRHTHKVLQQVSIEDDPFCVKTNFNQTSVRRFTSQREGYNTSLVVSQLIDNIALLHAVCDFTYKQHIVTPKLHQRLRHET